MSKTELEAMGESTDDLSTSTSKLREQIKGLTGVDIMLDENTYKSTAEIIKGLGPAMKNLSDVSKANVLEKLAGKTRASVLAGLLENYETIDKVIQTAENASGSALKENEKYIDSVAGRIDQLTNKVQEFWYEFLASDLVKTATVGLTKILGLVVNITDTLGTIPTTLGIIAGYNFFRKFGKEKGALGALSVFGNAKVGAKYANDISGISIVGKSDVAIINEYSAALSGATTQQASLALSQTSLNKEQKKAILIRQGLSSTTNQVSVAELTNTLQSELSEKQNKDKILSHLGVTSAKKVEEGATIDLTEAQIFNALISEKIPAEKAAEIASRFSNTGAMHGEITAHKLLAESAKESMIALAHNPLFWTGIAIAGVIGIVKAYDKWNSAARKVDKANKQIESTQKNIDAYNDEIDSLENLQTKLKDAEGNKAELAKVSTELNKIIGQTPGLVNGESEAFEQASFELKAYIEQRKKLREVEIDKNIEAKAIKYDNLVPNNYGFNFSPNQSRSAITEDKYYRENLEILESIGYYDKKISSGQTLSSIEQEEYDKLKERLKNLEKKYNLSDGQKNVVVRGANYSDEEFSKHITEQTDLAKEVLSEYIEENSDKLNPSWANMIINRFAGEKTIDEIKGILNNFTNDEKLSGLIKNFNTSFTDNIEGNEEYALNNLQEYFNTLKTQYPQLTEELDQYFEAIVSGAQSAKKEIEEVKKGFNSIQETIKGVKDAYETYTEVAENYISNGSFSLDDLEKITSKFPELEDEVYEYTMGLRDGNDILDLMLEKSNEVSGMSIEAFREMYLTSKSGSEKLAQSYNKAFDEVDLKYENTKTVMENINSQIISSTGEVTDNFKASWETACKMAGVSLQNFANGFSALMLGDWYDGNGSGVYKVLNKGFYYKDGSGMDGAGENLTNVLAMQYLEDAGWYKDNKGQWVNKDDKNADWNTEKSQAYQRAYNVQMTQYEESRAREKEIIKAQQAYNNRIKANALADITKAQQEKQEELAEHDKSAHLEQLKEELDYQQQILDTYEKQIEVLSWGEELIGEDDFVGKADLLNDKLSVLQNKGSAIRSEMERVMNLAPQTGEEAVEIANKLSDLGENLRENVSLINEMQISLVNLHFEHLDSITQGLTDRFEHQIDAIDKRIEILEGKNSSNGRFMSQLWADNIDMDFALLSDFETPIEKKRKENQSIIELEKDKQAEIDKILLDAIERQNKENEEARQKERQKIIGHYDEVVKIAQNAIDNIEKDIEVTGDEVGKDIKEKSKNIGDNIEETAKNTANNVSNIFKDAWNDTLNYFEDNPINQKPSSGLGDTIYKNSLDWLGTPYVWGGNSKNGVDCSGLTQQVLFSSGIKIPRTADEQYDSKDAQTISKDDLEVGDLVFYTNKKGNKDATHVAIYVGDGQVIHSPKPGAKVRFENIDMAGLYYLGAKRYYQTESNIVDTSKVTNDRFAPYLASGTPNSSKLAKNIGVAGENYKSEILVDKHTGKMEQIDSPTLIDLRKTDVVGEKDTASILKNNAFADGTVKFTVSLEDELSALGEGGNVNLLLRPEINTQDLIDAGWKDIEEGIATVYSSTYSNKDETIAINFTPIIVDPITGEYKGVLSPDELQKYAEEVISSVRTDDLKLQIGASFNGKDAISNAEDAAELIHTDHEYLSKGLFERPMTDTEIEAVFDNIAKKFNAKGSELTANYKAEVSKIMTDNTLTNEDKTRLLNEAKHRYIYGTDGTDGYGQLQTDWALFINNFRDEVLDAADKGIITPHQDLIDKINDTNSNAVEAVQKVEDTADDIAQTISDRYSDDYDDYMSDIDNWMDIQESLDSLTDNEKMDTIAKKLIDSEKAIKNIQLDPYLSDEAKEELIKEIYENEQEYVVELYDFIKEKYTENLEYRIEKEQAFHDIKEAEFDLINKTYEKEKEAQKALSSSLIGSMYLDPETRKLVYNEEDYQKELGTILRIREETEQLSIDYYNRINQLGEDELYKKEEITNEYKRQLAIKEKELEIAGLEVELQKKKDQLNNVLAEKNVRQVVNGRMIWVADTEKVRQATEELMDAQYEMDRATREKGQQEVLDSYQINIDSLNTQVAKVEEGLVNFEEMVNNLGGNFSWVSEQILAFGNTIGGFIANMSNLSFGEALSQNKNVKGTTSSSGGSNGYPGYYDPTNAYKNNDYAAGIAEALIRGDWESASIGNDIRNDKINYLGLGEDKWTSESASQMKDQGYASGVDYAALMNNYEKGSKEWNALNEQRNNKIDSEGLNVEKFAKGTSNAHKGKAIVNEEGQETYITTDGTIHSFDGGEIVLTAQETERLYNMVKGSGSLFNNNISNIKFPEVKSNQTTVKTNQLNGDIIIQNPQNFDDFVRQLTQAFNRPN